MNCIIQLKCLQSYVFSPVFLYKLQNEMSIKCNIHVGKNPENHKKRSQKKWTFQRRYGLIHSSAALPCIIENSAATNWSFQVKHEPNRTCKLWTREALWNAPFWHAFAVQSLHCCCRILQPSPQPCCLLQHSDIMIDLPPVTASSE